MPGIRFPDYGVFCPNCGRESGISYSELYNKMNFNCPHCHFPIKVSEFTEDKPVEEPVKTCPFRFIGYATNPMGNKTMECQKERCGIWCEYTKCCGFAALGIKSLNN